MGIFDISTQLKSHNTEKKEEILNLLKERFKENSASIEETKNSLVFKKFKGKKVLLNYDLKIDINSSKESFSLDIEGELQNAWILVILIVFSIIFTYGIGVILVIAFAFLQKLTATKFIEESFEKIKKEIS